MKLDEIRGSPLSIGSLEEMIDDNHCIVSTTNGPEYYVNILSFVDFDQLEPGCSVLLHNKASAAVARRHAAARAGGGGFAAAARSAGRALGR